MIVNKNKNINSKQSEHQLIANTMKTHFHKLNQRKLYNKKFYREFDVLHHIKLNDFWVILNGCVLDLSHLVRSIDTVPTNSNDFTALHQLNMFGGMDVSKLFMERSTNKLEMFQLKSHTDYGKLNGCHWWNDPVLIVGSITAQERHICVRNRSNGTQLYLTVCEEDSIYNIQTKFCGFYAECNSDKMIWRKNESTCCPSGYLFLDRTLTENGLPWCPANEITYLWIYHQNQFKPCCPK